MISIQLLGQVSICTGTGRASANGSKMWTVASMLASHPNTFVSIDRLIDEVWEHDPPISAVANIRTYISGLRRILGVSASRITGQRTGYRLELGTSELDMSQFERLVGAGRAAFAGGDAATSAASFHRALTLFPGPALIGVRPGQALTGVVGMLAEQRLSATDDLFAAELELGHHADLVSPLRRHVRAHPLRERSWGHLMLALYRCGDPAAALSAFGQARAVLITELGIEPGVHLRSLQQAILRRSPELDALVSEPSGALPAPAVEVLGTAPIQTETPIETETPVRIEPAALPAHALPPNEVPRTTPWFTGRAAQLADIRAAFARADAAPPVIAVHGPAGSGTSTLVIRAAHDQAGAYPDGVLYLDMRDGGTPMAAQEAARRLLATLDPTADTLRARARLRSVLTSRRVLLVLDNVTSIAQVEGLLPSSAGTALLIASTQMLPTLDAHHISLNRFTAAESYELLRSVAGATRIDSEPMAAVAITSACEHLPLTVRIAGARLAARPDWRIADLAARLVDEDGRLDELSIDGLSARECLERAHETLVRGGSDTDLRTGMVFVALGQRTGSTIGLHEAATWLNTSTRDAETMLIRLAAIGLLDAIDGGCYALLPLARAFARERFLSTPVAVSC